MYLLLKLAILWVFLLWVYAESMTVIPERANVTYFNKKYILKGTFNVRRYSRKSGYVMNLYGTTLITFANNVTVDVYFSQYLHNEYRRSFVEGHYKLCDFINNEPYIGGMVKMAGCVCPLPPGDYAFSNMTAPTKNFPNVFPFEKGRIDLNFSVASTNELISHVFVEALFKQPVGSRG